MNSSNQNQEGPGIDLQEILFVLFRHKGKIILFSIIGLIAAAVTYFTASKYYQSDSKLLIRYVLDRSAVDAVDSQLETLGRGSEGVIGAEVEILGSWDLAVKVAQSVGPERILAGTQGEISAARAAAMVRGGIEVTTKKSSNVINVSFRAKNPEIVQPVLDDFVRQYFEMHLDAHRSKQAFDFVSQQSDEVRRRIVDIQDQLKKLKDQAGITSLSESNTALNSQIAKLQESLMEAEATKSEQSARLAHFTKSLGLGGEKPKSEAEPSAESSAPQDVVQQYRVLVEQVAAMRKTEFQLLSQYTKESSMVRAIQTQIRGIEQRKTEFEAKYPSLTAVAAKATGDSGQPVDVLAEQANLLATEAKLGVLRSQLETLQAAMAKIHAVAAQIEDLEKQKEIQEKTYAEFQTKLETQRVNEALDPSKIPNISVVQKPSPPAIVVGTTKKLAMGLAAGGVVAGIGVALLFGMLLDRTVKRPAELEQRLGIPMMLQIPKLSRREIRWLHDKAAGSADERALTVTSDGGRKSAAVPWSDGHFIRPFAQIIRDRLILAFELKRVTHKPKLVAVTGLSGGEGASTLAGGLAAALSETDHDKVLLVDMNSDNPEMRPFIEGRSGAALMEVIDASGEAIAATDNLYFATGERSGTNSRMIAPRRFYEMIPMFRESQFDYIIFDMPPMEQGSATLAISGFMDKVLLVVEPERSDRAALKRAHAELVAARADVAAVVNKTRNGIPRWALG